MPGSDINRVLRTLARKHGVDLKDVGPKTSAMLRELAESHLEASRLATLLEIKPPTESKWPTDFEAKH